MSGGGRVPRGGGGLLGADRGGVLQDRRVQGLGEGQRLRDPFQAPQLQRQVVGGALQAADGSDAPDPRASAVPRLPGGERPSVQPRGVRAAEREGREDREERRGACEGSDQHPQRGELAGNGRGLGDEPVQAEAGHGGPCAEQRQGRHVAILDPRFGGGGATAAAGAVAEGDGGHPDRLGAAGLQLRERQDDGRPALLRVQSEVQRPEAL